MLCIASDKIPFYVQILLYPLAISGKNEKISFCEKDRFIRRLIAILKKFGFSKKTVI